MTTQKNEGYRYSYHMSPTHGWLNDPNGLCWFNGKYHVFYQTNPDDNQPGTIFWGHFSSTDLIDWQQESFALRPDQAYDENGCYSGSAIAVENQLYVMYTGHKNLAEGYEETQCLAVSADGFQFEKAAENPIIARPPSDNTQRFRDPKIWQGDAGFYAVIGGESAEHRGQVNLFYAPRPEGPWEYRHKLVVAKSGDGIMWECPDYFEIEAQGYLITSPKEMRNQGINGFAAVWVAAAFHLEKTVTDYRLHLIDEGQDFYAPQTFWDPIKKRRLLFAWFGMPGLQEQEKREQVGALTLPREVVVRNGRLCFPPITELNKLRLTTADLQSDMTISAGSEIVIASEKALVAFSLRIEQVAGMAYYELIFDGQELRVQFTDHLRRVQQVKQFQAVKEIRLFLDQGLTELFINDGDTSFSNKCELVGELKLTYDGTAKGHVYRLKSAVFGNSAK